MKLLLEGMRPYPAHVVSRTNDLLAHNPGGLRLFAGLGAQAAPSEPARPARPSDTEQDEGRSRHRPGRDA